MSAALSAPERRRRARAMVDEDAAAPAAPSSLRDGLEGGVLRRAKEVKRTPVKASAVNSPQAPPTPPSSSSRTRTTSASSSSALAPSSPSRKVVVKLNGRVYRQPEEGDPRTAAEFESDLLLSEPTETVEDLETERRAEKRRKLEHAMRKEKMLDAQSSPGRSPVKGKGRVLTFDSDEEGSEVKATLRSADLGTPTKRPRSSARPCTPPPQPAFSSKPPTTPSPSLGLPFGHPFSPNPAAPARSPLPPPLAALLSLHSAVERSLILHLSTAGSSIASSSSEVDATSGEAVVRMTNLIDLPTLSKMLESTGKRFGEDDLRRLVWLWEGCGGLAGDSGFAGRTLSEDEAGGMGFLVTRARTSSAAGARISGTYGIGISVAVKANPQLPKFELVSPGRRKQQAPASPSSVGKGRDGMSIVALWTQGKEQRKMEVERRLRSWAMETMVKTEDGAEEEVEPDATLVFDWRTSASSMPSSLLTSIPRAALPLLNPAVSAIPSTLTPSPKKPSTSANGLAPSAQASLPVASPEKFVSSLLQGKPIKAKGGKAAARAAAMRERIQAKQDAQKKSAYHASLSALSGGDASPTKRSLKRHGGAGGDADPANGEEDPLVTRSELFKRNAMLSRLGSVCDVVSMRCNARPTRFDEVCAAVANSPLLAIGHDEADQSLTFLASHFPDFCYTKLVGAERWMCLRGTMKAVEVKEKVKAELERVAEAMKLR
ncbi:hypothetical protein JCM8097_005773 [Rhodosporidiobolus ruineniae]